MRLATYRIDGRSRPCLIVGDAVADIGDHFRSLRHVVSSGPDALSRLRELAPRLPRRDLAEVTLAAPIQPRNIFCIGWNYRKHFEEGAGKRDEELPDYPNFFSKATGSTNGPFDPVPAHEDLTQSLDWEAELAVVIGSGGAGIPHPEALDRVFGYTVANDISARDLQRRHGVQWLKGKSLDGSCPIGPWIVTADEIPDPQDLGVTSAVNDEPKQKASTKQMVFTVAALIALLSEGITLAAGDLVLTGTPEGVGMGQDPPQFLRPGDVVECSVERIGTIRNAVVRAG